MAYILSANNDDLGWAFCGTGKATVMGQTQGKALDNSLWDSLME